MGPAALSVADGTSARARFMPVVLLFEFAASVSGFGNTSEILLGSEILFEFVACVSGSRNTIRNNDSEYKPPSGTLAGRPG
jgi:hypothetical protein